MKKVQGYTQPASIQGPVGQAFTGSAMPVNAPTKGKKPGMARGKSFRKNTKGSSAEVCNGGYGPQF